MEPILGVVGACLPLMAPLFKKLREMSTKKSSGGVSGDDWTHKRLEVGHTPASKTTLNKDNAALTSHHETVPFGINKEDVPLTSHKEWAESDGGESEKRQSSIQPEFVIRAPPRPFYR